MAKKKIIIGDLWEQQGYKVVSTNLGGVHGRGLAQQASQKGLINRANIDFDTSPKGGDVITLAVKGKAPETAKIPGRAFSEQTTGGNVRLLESEVDKLIKFARKNPNKRVNLPFIGLGFGEGNPKEIQPILEKASKEPNIFLISKDEATVKRYESSFRPGVRSDSTSRSSPTALTSTKKGLARFHELQGEYYNESAQRVKDYKKVSYSDLPKGLVKALKSQFSQSIDQFGTEKNPKNPGTTTRKTEYALEKLIGGLDRAKKQGFLSFDMASGDKIQVSEKVAKQIIQNDLSSVVWSKHIDKKQKYFNLSDTAQTELRKISGHLAPALDAETGYTGPGGRLSTHIDTHGSVDPHQDTKPGNLKKQEGHFLGEEGEGRFQEKHWDTDDPHVRYYGQKTKKSLVKAKTPEGPKTVMDLKVSDIFKDPPDLLTEGPKSPQSGFASETRLSSIDPKIAIHETGGELHFDDDEFAKDMEERAKQTKPRGYDVVGPEGLDEKIQTTDTKKMTKSTLLTSARRAGQIRRQATLDTIQKNYGDEGVRAYKLGELLREGQRSERTVADLTPRDIVLYPPPGKGKKTWGSLRTQDWVRPKKKTTALTSANMETAETWSVPQKEKKVIHGQTGTAEKSISPVNEALKEGELNWKERQDFYRSQSTGSDDLGKSKPAPPSVRHTTRKESQPTVESPKREASRVDVQGMEAGEKNKGTFEERQRRLNLSVKPKVIWTAGMPYLGLGSDIIHGLKTMKESKKTGKKFGLGSFIPSWAKKIAFGESIPRS